LKFLPASAQIKDEFMTCANDATLRLWMVEHKGKKTRQIIKCKNKKNGLRTNPTACTYSRDGLLGTVHAYNNSYVFPIGTDLKANPDPAFYLNADPGFAIP
jgi:hypothetical protein